jgi:hypothetical protein
MLVKHVAAGPVSDYVLEGSMLTIAGVNIDLASRQSDVATTVDLTVDRTGAVTEGLSGSYVASVVIPPRQYQLVDSGEIDVDGEPIIERQPLPLNVGAVLLFLWPVK